MRGNLSQCLGFTLTELMVTVAIIGIIASLGVPSFQAILQQNRASSTANEFVAALTTARSEAIKRGKVVSVCKSSNITDDEPSCSEDASWSSGWIVFVDANYHDDAGAGSIDDGDTRLKIGRPSGSNTTLLETGDGNSAYVSFLPTGFIKWDDTSSEGTLEICAGSSKRTIDIGTSGRVHITKGTCS